MLINWFTVGAQLVNFAVLVWLMKRFLYQPVLNAMDARERRVATQASELGQQQSALRQAQADLSASKNVFDQERGALLAKAVADAAAARERIVTEAHQQADAMRTTQQAAAQQDAVTLSDDMQHLATAEIFAIARRTLSDLASADLEERIGEVFTRRLRQLDATAKKTLAAALETPNGKAMVRSRFVLPGGVRATVQNALNETFGAEVPLQFETAPATVCGIELTAGGQKLAWTIDEYLRLFQQKILALPAARGVPEAAATAIDEHPVAAGS
jgi:F-type H+-transporting ATPase subunit b